MNQYDRTASALLVLVVLASIPVTVVLALRDEPWLAGWGALVTFIAIARIQAIGSSVRTHELMMSTDYGDGPTDEHPTFRMN